MKHVKYYIFLPILIFSWSIFAVTTRNHQPISQSARSSSPPRVSQRERLWNLQNADIRAVIEAISRMTGKNFLVDPRVQGKVTIVSSTPISPKGLYQMFLSALQVLGYTAVPSGHLIKIVPDLYARQMNTPLTTALRPGAGDEAVVRVVTMRNVPVSELVTVLKPLMPESSVISAYTPSNSLILAGRASNINRLATIIQDVDKSASNQIQVVSLKYASATKILSILRQLQNAERASNKISTISLAADAQSNTIILSGNRKQRLRMSLLIDKLDKPGPRSGGNTDVIKLNYLSAKKLATTLSKIAHSAYLNEGQSGKKTSGKGGTNANTNANSATNETSTGGNANTNNTNSEDDFNKTVSIQPEPDSNSIIISAPPSLMVTMKRVIKQVDVRPQQILVEAIIAEVSQSLAHQLGISWGTGSTDTSDNGFSLDNPYEQSSDTSFQPGIGFISPSSFTNIGFLKKNNLEMVIQALNTNSDADILSTPSIVVANNQKAQLAVGKTISVANREYATSDGTGSVGGDTNSFTPYTTYQQQQVDLTLNVIPQISPDSTVRLNIKQQNDSLENPNNPGTTPVINNSLMKTDVLVKSGQILVLGGLITHDLTDTESKVPILGDIPILGRLFQMKDKQVDKKYILAFIRPIILSNPSVTDQVTEYNYNFIRQQQLQRWRGHNLINKYNQTPLMQEYAPAKLKLPEPFNY